VAAAKGGARYAIERGIPFEAATTSPEGTRAIGYALGCLLRAGDTVLLYGDVGAGKTVFVSGILDALDAPGPVTSPTYTIMNVYEGAPGALSLYHFDAYRIEAPEELYDTGFFDYAGGDGIVAVEWAERLFGCAPPKRVEVRICGARSQNGSRAVRLSFLGE
jgi:tRNA threonylcarbamoyladenosine biosynthesis protein TsaE